MKPFLLLGLAFFMVIGVFMFQGVMQSSDYEAGNRTGNDTVYTNQTIQTVDINNAWWGVVVILIILLAFVAVFKMF